MLVQSITSEYFEYMHLPKHLQQVSAPFHDLACDLITNSDLNEAEKQVSLRKLLEAKDAAVRARVLL